MKHRGTQKIKTQRLTLRAFSVDDAAAMYANWSGSREVTRYLTWQAHQSEEEARHQIETWQNEAILASTYRWCIELNALDVSVGCIEAVCVDEAVGAVEVGCCIGRNWWNQGIATEAFQAVMEFFFRDVGANRVAIRYDTKNGASAKIAQRCGLKLEGIARACKWDNDGIADMALCALLRKDWLKMHTEKREDYEGQKEIK